MRRKVTLLYQCDRKWDELRGDDPVQRRCSECRLDVVDLRSFTEEEADEYLLLADVAQEEVCGVIKTEDEAASCAAHPDCQRPKTELSTVVGRMSRKPDPDTDRGRWELVRRQAVENAGTGDKTAALARIEQRAAIARTKMGELLERVRTRGGAKD
jgi:hypothetical protein